ncbi:MAG TPA: hypothetical protein VI953_01280, partial [Candidatus Paceibacterota bacterium]
MKKQAIVLALSLAVIAPSLAFADLTTTSVTVTSSVSAQIALLQAQIKSLMAQIEMLKKGSQTMPERWCHDFNSNLGVGVSSAEVTALAKAFSSEGLVDGDLYVYGTGSGIKPTLDEKLASVVTAFQQKYKSE